MSGADNFEKEQKEQKHAEEEPSCLPCGPRSATEPQPHPLTAPLPAPLSS